MAPRKMPIRLPQTNTEPPKKGASTRLPAISRAISTAPETKISAVTGPRRAPLGVAGCGGRVRGGRDIWDLTVEAVKAKDETRLVPGAGTDVTAATAPGGR